MKKSLIALAVAGTFAAPAYAATANVDVYGRLNVSIEDSNGDGVTPQVTDRQSIIGFKGTEDLGGGLKGIWQIESTISGNADGVGGGNQLAGRNSFVGLSGSFGTVLIGRHDTPYKLATGRLDPFSDTLADYNGDGGGLTTAASTNKDGFTQLVHGTHDHRSNNAVAYVSPNLSGFTLSAAVVMTNRNDTAADNEGNGTADAYSLSATYAQGPWFAALAYQHVEDLCSGGGCGTPPVNIEETPAWKLGLGYNFGNTRLGLVYEDVEGKNPAGAKLLDRQSWLVNVVHNMGPIALKAQYGQVDDRMAANRDQTKFSLGADYSLSKRTTTGVVYTADSTDNNTTGSLSAWGVYVRHTF